MELPREISGLSEVANQYDGVILDLWGVVHDGVKPFPDVIPTLKALKQAKRSTWLLSNAPRRSHTVIARLAEMGITADLYSGIMTSGEATWVSLKDRYLEQWGRKCFHLGPARDSSLYEGLDIEILTSPQGADFVLNSGPYDLHDKPSVYNDVLRACAEARLPMICANPDKVVHIEHHLAICAGTTAQMYEQLEGSVTYFGKPHRMVYSLCLEAIGSRKILAVGDAMATDIEGATGAGIDSVLVTSGIHRDTFPQGPEKPENQNHLELFFKPYPYRPTYFFDKLTW